MLEINWYSTLKVRNISIWLNLILGLLVSSVSSEKGRKNNFLLSIRFPLIFVVEQQFTHSV